MDNHSPFTVSDINNAMARTHITARPRTTAQTQPQNPTTPSLRGHQPHQEHGLTARRPPMGHRQPVAAPPQPTRPAQLRHKQHTRCRRNIRPQHPRRPPKTGHGTTRAMGQLRRRVTRPILPRAIPEDGHQGEHGGNRRCSRQHDL